MKSFKMIVVLSWLGLSACGEPELPPEPLESEHGQDAVLAPSLAFGSNGQLAIAWAGPNDLNVRRFTGTRWETLGNGLSAFSGDTRAFWSAVQVDGQGNPVVAWGEDVPGNLLRKSILVRRWADGSWATLGGPLNIGPESVDAYKPSLRLDPEGNPLVAWSEKNGDERIAVRRWGPSGWQALGPTTVAPGTAWGLELAGGTPILLSRRFVDSSSVVLEVRRWTGSTWELLGAPLGKRAIAPQVRADAAGNLFLAWLDESEESPYISRIRVVRWSGTAWDALGADVAVSDNNHHLGVPALDLDAEGRPLVAWIHGAQTSQSLRVARWNGEDWNVKAVDEAPVPGSTQGWSTIGFHPDEGVVVAWTPHESLRLRVRRVLP